jgi:VWFA-related protein
MTTKPSALRLVKPRVLVPATLALVLAALPAAAQKDKKTFADTTSVVVVEVPVTVVRDGEPVADLTAANFEIYDGKQQQKIIGFEVIDLQRAESFDPLAEPMPIAARRHFMMLFDMAFSEPESIVKARRAARDLVDQLHPTDLAGVAVYTSTRGAELLLGFTSDRRQVELAIETLGVPELVERTPDPLGLVFGNVQDFIRQNEVDDAAADLGGAAGDAIQEIANERIIEAVSRITSAERSAQLNKVSAFTGNLEALANLMASIDGRKHLVYFSEGIPNDLLVGEERSVEQTQARAGLSVADTEEMVGDTFFGATQAQNQLEDVVEGFRRAGCAIQAVDIGGLRALNEVRGRQAGEESMVSMSKDTGGEFYRNFNDLGEAMTKVLQRTSVTYLLAFQPQNLKLDGEYHKLRVKLVEAPRGARASHRAGYYAPKPFEERNAFERRWETAEIVMSDEDGGPINLAVLAAAFPVAGQKAYVPVVLEVGGESLLAGRADGALELEIYGYATDVEGGRVHDFFVQNLGLDLGQVGGALKQSGLKYWGHFDLPPGEYVARIMVRDRRDGRHSLQRQRVSVPAADDGLSVLLPPMFPEAPGKWVLVREGEERQRDVPYPFMASGQPYIPAARPVVPARGATPFYLQGLNLGAGVELTGEVLSAEGAAVKGAELTWAEPTKNGGVYSVVAQLETNGLKSGEYTLVGTVTGVAGPNSSSIRFVVP